MYLQNIFRKGLVLFNETLQRLLRLRFKFMEYFLEGLQNPTAFSNTSSEHSEMLEAVKSVVVEMHKKGRFSEAEMPHVDLAQRRQPPSQSNTKEVEQKIPPVLADIFNAYPKSSAKRNEKNGFTREKLEPMPQVKPKAQENGKAYRQKEQNSWKLEYPNTSLERPGSSSAKPSKQKGSERWPEKYGNGKAARQKAVDEWKPDHPEEMIDWQGGQGSRPSKQRDPERWPESQGNGRMSSQKGSNEWKPDHPKDKYDWQGDHGHAKNSKQRESDNWKSQKGSFDWQENQGKSSRQKEHYYDERGTKDYFEENGQGRASRNKYQEKRKPEPFRHPENYQEEPYQRDRWSQDDRGREEEFPRSKGQDNWRYREDPYYEPPEKFIDPGISKILEVVNKLEGNRPGTSYRKESSRQSDVRHGGDDRNGNNRRTNGPLLLQLLIIDPVIEIDVRTLSRGHTGLAMNRGTGTEKIVKRLPLAEVLLKEATVITEPQICPTTAFHEIIAKITIILIDTIITVIITIQPRKRIPTKTSPGSLPRGTGTLMNRTKALQWARSTGKTRGGGPSRQNDRGKYRDRNRNSENEKNPRNGSKKGPYYHD
ncbi:unnamed protein product [Caenorhabditis auriculariae]|uniref:Uncharacterized protein n=1 Tax=Caenorhabditis auriculariae TaxID=2777116 RepID=A0A8S1GQ19_9PELO|nr:unnamed protein product [Caenorhabditis auriculariae]